MYALPLRRWISLILVKLGPAHTSARLLRNIRPLSDPPFACRTPYDMGDGNIVQRPRRRQFVSVQGHTQMCYQAGGVVDVRARQQHARARGAVAAAGRRQDSS